MGQAHLRSFLWKGGEGKGHGGKQGASQHPVFVFLSISMQFGCNVQVGQSWVVGALVLVILFTAVGSKCSVLMRRLAAGLGGGASSGAELPGPPPALPGSEVARRWRAGGRGGRGRAEAADSPAINSLGYMSRSAERRPQFSRPPAAGRGHTVTLEATPALALDPVVPAAARALRWLRGQAAPPTCLSPARPRRAGQQLPHIWLGRPQPPPRGKSHLPSTPPPALTRRSYSALRSSAIRRSWAPISRAHCSSSPRIPGAAWVGPPARAPGALGTGDSRCCSAGESEG